MKHLVLTVLSGILSLLAFSACLGQVSTFWSALHPTWVIAGDNDFVIYPKTNAEHCVADVRAAFEAIDFGRRRGKNFFSVGVGVADTGPRDHMQGVARLPGGWLVQSHTKGVFLTHFADKDEFGHSVWASSPDEGEPLFPSLPDVTRSHVGGLHAYHDIVAIPSSGGDRERVEIFRHRDGSLIHLSTFAVTGFQGAAHYASILPITGGDWLLAVGHDSRDWSAPHRVHLYVIPGLHAAQNDLRYLGRWGRGRTRDDFQSASLLGECTDDVFIVGTGIRRVQSNEHAKLYRVLSFVRTGGEEPTVEVDKLSERSPGSERNDCSLDAGATFFPTSNGALSMYCTEKEIRHGNITTREYRDEDRR